MEVSLPKGRYVVAVSGGVDSIVLLNMLSKQKDLSLVVAHFDHGIRKDSTKDKEFVKELAKDYGLPFEYTEGKLGPKASEATARAARYEFLKSLKKKYGAKAIVTAHHQDDVIETAIINLLRGTGRKGLSALASQAEIIRPMLGFSKKQILRFARKDKLKWREDSTNRDTKYLRNYVRHNIVANLSEEQRAEFVRLIKAQRSVNTQLDAILLMQAPGKTLARQWFSSLPHTVAREVLATWLRAQGLRDFDRTAIERGVVGAKTAKPGKRIAIKKGVFIEVGNNNLALTGQER